MPDLRDLRLYICGSLFEDWGLSMYSWPELWYARFDIFDVRCRIQDLSVGVDMRGLRFAILGLRVEV